MTGPREIIAALAAAGLAAFLMRGAARHADEAASLAVGPTARAAAKEAESGAESAVSAAQTVAEAQMMDREEKTGTE